MSRFTAKVLVWLVTIASCACFGEGGRSPFDVSPSPMPAAPAPPPVPAARLRITGLVLDASNIPVSGASVQMNAGADAFTAISDSAGAYAATFERRWNGVDISASKPGYERTNRFERLEFAEEVARNVRLHPILRLAAGSSLRLAINPDDSYCGFDYEYLCRTVRVTSPTAGLLTITAIADRASAVVGVSGLGEYPQVKSSSLTVEVNANSETSVILLVDWQTAAPEMLTLNTALQ